MKPYGWRDHLVVTVANAVLRLASKRYQQMLHGAWLYGLAAAARDEQEGRSCPTPHP